MAGPRDGVPRPRRRLLHTSDVHLGRFEGDHEEARRAESHAVFSQVLDAGIALNVDGLIIAGDFFDNARVRPDTLEFAATEIARFDRPVVIGPGNHDHFGKNSVYERYPYGDVRNLQIIRDPEGETVRLDGLDIEVWGKAHTEAYTAFEPFDLTPPCGEASWQIGVGHGHYIHPQALLHHSFHIREAHLVASERDYIALGHWDRMTRVAAGERTIAAYSGCPEGLSQRNGGWVMLVDLMEDGSVRLTAHPLGEEPGLSHDEIPILEGLAL